MLRYISDATNLKLIMNLLRDKSKNIQWATFSAALFALGDLYSRHHGMEWSKPLLLSAAVRFEAFHVFKVFVANPEKDPAVLKILAKNKDKLISYFEEFHRDREDEQFIEERTLLIQDIMRLDENGIM
jgi:calcium binding protein 39